MRPPRFSDDPTLPHHTACRASSTLHLPFPPPPCRSHRRGAALGVQFVNAQIPLGTQHFAFFYPVFSARDCALDPNVAMESLLLNGGFVYFDGLKPVQGKWQSSILGINVICPEGSAGILQFDGPYPLGPEAQRELQHQERMQPVTLAAIRQAGAESFAWVHPGEFGEGLGNVPAAYGAFTYTSRLGGGGEAIYFPFKVAPKQSRRGSDGGRRPGGGKADGKYSATHFLNLASSESQPEKKRKNLVTALMMASDDGDAETMQTVLLRGQEMDVTVDETGEDGQTALMTAAEGGHTHLVDTLVRQGADVWRRRKSDGKTALEAATQEATKDGDEDIPKRIACFEAATALLLPAFKQKAGEALIQAVKVASGALRQAKRQKQTSAELADELGVWHGVAQLTAAALLRTLDANQLRRLLEVPKGREALAEAVQHECKLVLGDTGVQLLLVSRWRGKLLEQLATAEARTPLGTRVPLPPALYTAQLLTFVLLLLPLNLLLLPVVTLLPLVEGWLLRLLPRLGGAIGGGYRKNSPFQREGYSETLHFYWASLYLLNVPFLRFVLASLFSLLLVSFITAMPPALDGHPVPREYPPLLLWCVAGLIFEAHAFYLDASAWRADPLKYMEAGGLVLASASLASDVIRDGDERATLSGEDWQVRPPPPPPGAAAAASVHVRGGAPYAASHRCRRGPSIKPTPILPAALTRLHRSLHLRLSRPRACSPSRWPRSGPRSGCASCVCSPRSARSCSCSSRRAA